MSKIILFIAMLVKEVQQDDLISVANDLTYKILLALFPFIIFLLALVGYFELDANYLLQSMENGLPKDVMEFITPFFLEVVAVKRPSILSTSLIFMLFSASSGFDTAIRCINKAYGQRDERNIVHRRAASVLLVFVFAITIILSMVMLIFNDAIYSLIVKYFAEAARAQRLFNLFGYLTTIGVLLICVILINRVALAHKFPFKALLPGAVVTVVSWVIFSKAFSIYVTNFSRYSTVYGSVAGIMLVMVWLNLICLALLIGSEINGILKVE